MASYQHLKATIRIGKGGLTEGILDEIRNQLDQHGVVKIKMLGAFTDSNDRKAVAKELAAKVGAKLMHAIGGIVVLKDLARDEKCQGPKHVGCGASPTHLF